MTHNLRVRRGPRGDAGDTLVEVLITIIILSVTGLALLEAFSATIGGSAQYRSLAANDVVLRAAAESAYSMIVQQPSPAYNVCATPSTYNSAGGTFNAPTNYTASITSMLYWVNDAWTSTVPSCTSTFTPQQITMTVTNPNGTKESTIFVVNNFGLAVASGSVVLSSLSPSSIGQDVTATMYLAGRGFDSDASVTLSGPNDVSVSTAYVSSTLLKLTVTALIGAVTGPRTVTVTNALEGTSGSSEGLLTVTTSPTVISVTPSVIAQGGNETLTVTGSSFASGMTAAILTSSPNSPGGDAGIVINSLTYVDPTAFTISVSVSPTAAVGFDTITVTIPGGASFTSSPLLQVTPPPTISSPTASAPCNVVVPNGTISCTITGQNFEVGAQVSISANGVVNNPTGSPSSSTSITVSVTGQGSSGATGNIVVTNPDGTTATVVNGFVNGA